MEWKAINNYDNYKINKNGEIINIKTQKNIKCFKSKDDYVRVYLYKKGIKKTLLLHRLLAQAFIPNPYNYKEINHKDENKHNNNVNNLEWCDRKYNCNYGTMQKRKATNKYKKIIQYDLNKNIIKIWNSIKEAGDTLKIHRGNISWCCNGKYKTSNGYIWKYYETNKF